ncbi:unnamed protein product [Closterium sp. NIES-65]|nr:unnamed protein product [Closterium sp. NIES-65]
MGRRGNRGRRGDSGRGGSRRRRGDRGNAGNVPQWVFSKAKGEGHSFSFSQAFAAQGPSAAAARTEEPSSSPSHFPTPPLLQTNFSPPRSLPPPDASALPRSPAHSPRASSHPVCSPSSSAAYSFSRWGGVAAPLPSSSSPPPPAFSPTQVAHASPRNTGAHHHMLPAKPMPPMSATGGAAAGGAGTLDVDEIIKQANNKLIQRPAPNEQPKQQAKFFCC